MAISDYVGFWLGYFKGHFFVVISNKVGLGQFEVQFTVAIRNVVSSRLGHFEGKFTVAISNVVGSWFCHF